MKKIESFDFLKVIGMFMIFFNHVKPFFPFAIPDFGARGCEIFILLSGFLLTYNHIDKDFSNLSFSARTGFTLKHISKFYILHLITLFIAIIFYSIDNTSWIKSNISAIILNVFLLQSWSSNISICWGGNAVSWFLSSLLLCYLVFPYLHTPLKNIRKSKSSIFILSIILIYFCCFQDNFNGFHSVSKGYVLHIFPPTLLLEFILGCLLGIIYIDYSSNFFPKNLYTYIYGGGYILVLFLCDTKWNRAFFIITELVLIFLFACLNRKDFFFKLINSKLIRIMSKISFDFYLIHFVVILFYTKYVSTLEKLIEYKLDWKINVLLIFLLTIIGCLIWNMLEIISKKIKNNLYGSI